VDRKKIAFVLVAALAVGALALPSASARPRLKAPSEVRQVAEPVPAPLCDPGFEAGALAPCWSPFDANAGVTSTQANSGSFSATLCPIASCLDGVFQTTHIPAGATGGTLSVWYRRTGDPSAGSTCNDALLAGLINPADPNNPSEQIVGGACAGDFVPNLWSQLVVDVGPYVVTHQDQDVFVLAQGQTSGAAGPWNVDDFELTFETDTEEVSVFPRSVSLSLRKHIVAKGAITQVGDFLPCMSGQKVLIQKRRPNGSWATIATPTTGNGGLFSKRIPDRPGVYRARIATKNLNPTQRCSQDNSPTRRHSHN
jgi:hypothetical protein